MHRQRGFVLLELIVFIVVMTVVVLLAVKAVVNHQAKTDVSVTAHAAGARSPAPSATPAATSGSLSPTSKPAPIKSTSGPSQTPTPAGATPAPTPQLLTATEYYIIRADGVTAQESPVTTVLSTTGNVKLIINLSCASACQFQLASDTYPLGNSPIYTASQTVSYTLTSHGTWYFYNQFIPNVKFGIKF